ncbi:MAG TPA: MaoC/PaaZ C-terminal domain-containing protein [Longimicrobiaceae bacterium]|nr:MaoC/PaaZ C-terminal domain-containing protein [Longimicrobiaceae bacterium]
MSASTMDWREGEALPELRLAPVGRLDLIRYAGASGDYNPIHTIDAEAEKAGLPGIIQHGMLTMAELGRLFSPHLGQALLREFRIRFTGMVFLGDEMVFAATVSGVEDHDAGRLARFDIAARTGEGREVANGTAELLVCSS